MARDRGVGNAGAGASAGGASSARAVRAGAEDPAGTRTGGAAPAGTGSPISPGKGSAAPVSAGTAPPARPGAREPGAWQPRHVYGPRPLGALVPGLTRPAFRRRSPAAAQILADWAAIVGPELAAATLPRRLSGATLTIACSGPMALELQHLSGALAGRINAHCGQVAVERLRFVQESLPPPAAPHPPAPLGPTPSLPGVPSGDLHDALASLGRAVAGRGRR